MDQPFDDTLTAAEKEAPTYLDWSNETLGRAVRETARLVKDGDGTMAMGIQGALLVLAWEMVKANVETLRTRTEGESFGQGYKMEVRIKLERRGPKK